jgi:3-oxoacyl-[acyl-carrier protein] reductase
VVVNFRSNQKAAEETLGFIREAGGVGETAGFDVADPEETGRQIAGLLTRHEAIDILVNNGETATALSHDLRMDQVLNTSCSSPLRFLRR